MLGGGCWDRPEAELAQPGDTLSPRAPAPPGGWSPSHSNQNCWDSGRGMDPHTTAWGGGAGGETLLAEHKPLGVRDHLSSSLCDPGQATCPLWASTCSSEKAATGRGLAKAVEDGEATDFGGRQIGLGSALGCVITLRALSLSASVSSSGKRVQ